MSTPALFKYYLQDITGKYYYVADDGTVQLSSSAKALTMSPTDWYNAQAGIARDMTYLGISKKFVVPITFGGNGAKILGYIFYTQGYEGYALFSMNRRNPTDWLHYSFFTAEVDFSKGVNNSPTFQVAMVEPGISALLTANQDVSYDIPFIVGGFLDTKAVKLIMKGVELQGADNFVSQDFTSPSIQFGHATYLPLSFTQHDGDFQVGNGGVVIGNPPSVAYADNWAFQVVSDFSGSINLNMPMQIGINSSASHTGKLRINVYVFTDKNFSAIANTGNTTLWEDSTACAIGTTRNVTASLATPWTFNFQAGQYIVFYVDCDSVGGAYTSSDTFFFKTFADASTFTINEVFKITDTPALAYRYYDFASKLISKVTNGTATLKSDFLSTNATPIPTNYYDLNPYKVCVTSGQGLTYQQYTNPVITSTLSDMYKDLRKWGLGLGVEGNQVVIEPLAHFFDPSKVICTIDKMVAGSFKISAATDFLGNILNVGYPDPTGDQLNMPNEFNAKQQYGLPVKRVQKTIDWSSPYNASTYMIELARVQTNNATPTQTSSNNAVFLIYISDNVDATTGYYYPQTESALHVTGVYSADSVYNIPLSPKSTLYWNIPMLKAMINNPSSQVISFQTASKNAAVSRNITTTITENANINLAAFSTQPLFKPYIFEFQASLPSDIFSLYDANKNGVIEFYDEDRKQWFAGFPIDAGICLSTKGNYDIKLICSPLVDTSLLI